MSQTEVTATPGGYSPSLLVTVSGARIDVKYYMKCTAGMGGHGGRSLVPVQGALPAATQTCMHRATTLMMTS